MKTSTKGYKYILQLSLIFLPLILIVLVMSYLDSALYTEVPIFVQFIIATLEGSSDKGELWGFLQNIFLKGETTLMVVIYASIGLMLYQTFRGVFKFIMGLFRNTLSQNIIVKMRKNLYKHIQTLSYSYHTNADLGDLIQRCTSDVDAVQGFICNDIPTVVSVFAVLFSAIFKMFSISPNLTWISLIILPVAFFSSFFYCLYVQKEYEKVENLEAELMTVMQENLSGVRVVKAFANEKFEIDKFEKKNKAYHDKSLRMQKISAVFWGFSDFTTLAQMALTMTYAVILVEKGDMSLNLADVITLITLVGTYIWPVRSLGRTIGNMGKSAVAAGRIKEILDLPSEYLDNGTLTPTITGNIVFDDVYFKFDDTDKHLLKGLSFEAKAGETIALIGKTGSGKSTVAHLLARLNDYQGGSIKLDGVELKDIEKEYLRKNVGLILQEPFLYSKTVYENIAITNKTVASDKVYEAAKLSAIEKDIKGFEKGYDTIVGEKGATLSGGQKQRIAIARMVLEEKPILIFDDSLSALDTETDLMIRNALKARNKETTTFIITHRITAAKTADKIIVLDNGCVSQMGTHDELINSPGLYKKLWEIQGNLELEFLNVLNGGGDKDALRR